MIAVDRVLIRFLSLLNALDIAKLRAASFRAGDTATAELANVMSAEAEALSEVERETLIDALRKLDDQHRERAYFEMEWLVIVSVRSGASDPDFPQAVRDAAIISGKCHALLEVITVLDRIPTQRVS